VEKCEVVMNINDRHLTLRHINLLPFFPHWNPPRMAGSFCRSIAPGDDHKTVAGRLTKEAWMRRARESDFDRPLRYGPAYGVV
jgi:hypothetical protein